MNLRPPGYEPDELPSCSTPRHSVAFIGDIDYYTLFQRFCQEGTESFFAAEAEDENAAADLLSRKPAATPIHAPPRGATHGHLLHHNLILFQFTPLREGRHAGDFANGHVAAFQFTPLREGRLIQQPHMPEVEQFQFTPLREGRPLPTGNCYGERSISIHAPPRGATGCEMWLEQYLTDFNSRPSARGDCTIPCFLPCQKHFNSRPSARGDPRYARGRRKKTFQFTPLREGRHMRAPKGTKKKQISIHAPPRGATGSAGSGARQHVISIHAPPRGAT